MNELLEEIAKLERLRDWATAELLSKVSEAREAHCNWDQIAGAIGITRAAVLGRYKGKVTEVDLRAGGITKRHPHIPTLDEL